MGSLGWPEILIIIGVLVLLFGAKKLPDLARSMGQSARVFKGEMKGLREDGRADEEPAAAEPAPLSPPQPASAQRPTRSAPPAPQPATGPGSTSTGQ